MPLQAITTSTLETLNAGFSSQFNTTLADLANTVPIFWPDLAMEVPTNSLKQIFGYMKGLTGYREWIDDRVVKGLDATDYIIETKKFENTFGVKRDDILYDNLGIYNQTASWFGAKARTFRDELLFPLIKAGASTIGPDGQYFYDTDHPLTDNAGSPITASNYVSGAGPLWFITANPGGIKPFVITKAEELDFVPMIDPTNERVFFKDEYVWGSKGRFGTGFFLWQLIQAMTTPVDATNFNAAFAALATRLGDKGSKMPLTPTTAYFPLSMRGDAAQTLLVEKLASGASNFNFKVVDVKFVPYLDWA